MTKFFVVYVLMWGNSVFSPGMHPVNDRESCDTQGKAFVEQMTAKGYGDDTTSWASYHCIELPYNGRM